MEVCCRDLQCADILTSGGEEMIKEGLAGGGDADNLPIENSAGADSGCGFSLSRPREGRDCRPKGLRTGEF